ncbi:MAG: hypothetical protein A3G75_08825 [Verrucomicrobia bacterium RIFCSPLOWO2_12_FULL_64_8]|nr:MAG: hypothetical protein A3G75_08825 [Verrucomicrobia bacterium RIFCSPLOWO2_12_FULL_64_8]
MPAFTHLLDTSVYSQPVRRSMHPGVAARWSAVSPESAAISAVCEAEVLYGLKKHGSPQMREAYVSILRGRFSVLPVDQEVAATYADLRCDCERQGVTVEALDLLIAARELLELSKSLHGVTVEALDLLIAATAKTHGLIVATLNVTHFFRIPGLAVEDWSQPPAPPAS